MPPDKVRFVGEPIAIVVAESIYQAKDAAELLEIAYAPLPAVVRAADAAKPGAPRLWDEASDNICIDIEVGDETATEDASRRAVHIVQLNSWVQRATGVPMEPRTTAAEYVDALGELGVRHIEMPATFERVWRAIRAGEAAAAVR
jgi:carbon-monoxide dehydrogenase large subunit